MANETPQSPGAEVATRGTDQPDAGVASPLRLATDLAIGAASEATRLALWIGATGWNTSVSAGRIVSLLPGARGAGRLLSTATRPLVDGGRETRIQSRSAVEARTQRLLEAIVPAVVEVLDIDQLVRRIEIDDLVRRIDIDQLVRRIGIDDLVQRIDIDQLVRRIEIDDLVGRIDIDDLVGRIDIDQLVQSIQIDAVMQRIDLDAALARIDVNRIAERIDVDAVVEQTELGTIVARSTSGFASEALDAARSQTANVDSRVSRAVNRVLRRKEGEVPIGPPLLTGERDTEDAASTSTTEARLDEPDTPDGGSS